MYLSQLDLKKKELFLDLSIHGAMSNNNFAQEQKSIVDAYCNEMGLPKSNYSTKRDLDSVLIEIKDICSPREKNIVLIELMALILGDGIYDTMEKEFVKKIQNIFQVSDEKIEEVILSINNLMDTYKALDDIIEN
ncbi:UNVERIFIED_CONTAM: hypothetical protein Cloal_2186 [Acetivibrio alkalicellulosi]